MIIISDTSPVSNLFIVNRLHLLHDIYGKIIIPTAVYRELMALANSNFDISEISNAPWIEQKQVKDISLLKKYENIIDEGESEAIVLAKELHADLLLIDESMGRQIAAKEGIHTIGLLGVLIEAKKKQLIKEVKPIMEELRTRARFRIKEELYVEVLKLVGE